MPKPFDPYYKWLGIPPEEQPPNHYRLLGVRLFEDDADVIDNAADGRMALLRNFQAGTNAPLSQQLLNELAAARITLLTKAKRAAYDEQLRRSQPLPPSDTSRAAPVPQPIPIAPALPQVRTAARRPAARPAWQRPTILAAAAAVVLVVAVLVIALNRDAGGPVVPTNGQQPAASLENLASGDRGLTLRVESPDSESRATVHEPAPRRPVDTVTSIPPAGLQQIPLPADKRVLLIFSFDDELKVAQAACEKYGLHCDVAKSFDKDRADYSAWHTVLCGTNNMDYWRSGEAAKPEAFNALEQFVAGGGHLIVLGSFNARGTGHLKRFGIETGFLQNENFEPAGKATELLLAGNEDLVPENGRLKSFGNFKIKPPHVALLKNGAGRYAAGDPKLATLVHDKGRLTYTVVEPNQTSGMWLITVLVSWVSRGSPIPAQDP